MLDYFCVTWMRHGTKMLLHKKVLTAQIMTLGRRGDNSWTLLFPPLAYGFRYSAVSCHEIDGTHDIYMHDGALALESPLRKVCNTPLFVDATARETKKADAWFPAARHGLDTPTWYMYSYVSESRHQVS